jgi:hypothetical protein
MIALFTDFGLEGPYTGQVKAVFCREAPSVPVIDLFADAPSRRPMEAAYLLAAYSGAFPTETVFFCVVDPEVGGNRPAVAARIDGRWFVGPGNGLFEPLLRRGETVETYVIVAGTGTISASFHGRDLFAPVVARLARGLSPESAGLVRAPIPRFDHWPDDLAAVVYVDIYGNLVTGLRADNMVGNVGLVIAGQRLERARTFSDVPVGTAFWYENANGLAEIAVNCGRADIMFHQDVGGAIQIVTLAS